MNACVRRQRPDPVARGFSLIELMVGITIALIVTLAIFSVLTASENRKRVTTAVNDINQSGAYSAYLLDQAIRNAGSGISNQWFTLRRLADIEGCALQVRNSTIGVVLPRASAFPAPFVSMPLAPVLAPLIIDPGAGTASDTLTIMSGSAGRSEAGARVIGPSVTGVAVVNTLGFSPSDLVLFAHPATEGPCVMSQVATGYTPQTPPTTNPVVQDLPLGGAYVHATGVDFSANLALGLGDTTTNRPQFKMYAVSAERQLVAYDLLDLDGTGVPQQLADGVVLMKAVYGVDTNGDNVIDSWEAPTAPGAWSPATLRSGTAAAAGQLRQIVAVRLALILRTSLPEKDAVQADRSFTLFSGLTPAGVAPLMVTFGAAGDDRFRYRLIETTIPLRNNLL